MTPERIATAKALCNHAVTQETVWTHAAEVTGSLLVALAEVERLQSLLGAGPDRVAVLTETQYVIDLNRVQPVEWELGPSPMLGRVDCRARWLPVDNAYGYALRIIAACDALHKAAQA